MSQRTDYNWFINNINDLYKQYGQTYLLIKDQRVLGIFDTYGEGVHAGEKIAGLGYFIVQRTDKDQQSVIEYIN